MNILGCIVAVLAAGFGALARAQVQVPSGFVVDDLITSGVAAPMDVDWLPDGRMLIAERAGRILLWTGTGPPVAIGSQGGVITQSERGLLSLAVDPDFPNNGYIYLWYARSGSLSVTRWTLVGDRANPASTSLAMTDERRLVNTPDVNGIHNGGVVRFGPDRMLYVSMGDDGSRCSAQAPTPLQGKIVRLDVSAVGPGGGLVPPALVSLVPADNPVAGSVVFATGLRNPFRVEIDPVTGALYIGDVGEVRREELSECPAGGGQPQRNFGWPWFEATLLGTACSGGAPANPVAPIAEENHNNGWSSIVAGPRYRNLGGAAVFGASYEGSVFYADYFTGNVRHYRQSAGAWGVAPVVSGQPSTSYWATGLRAIAALRQGPDGGVFAVQHGGPGSSGGGFIRRIRPLGPVPSVTLVAGSGQFAPAGQPFSQPLEFEVRDAAGVPLPGGVVNLAVAGPGTTASNSLTADASGRASAVVSATNQSGITSAITVTAATPGGDPAGVDATVYRRNIDLRVIQAGQTFVILQIANASPATNPTIPLIVTIGSPSDPGIPTAVGLVCPDPFAAASFVIEDSLGVFGGVSLATRGAVVGTPGVNQVYTFPAGILPGLQWKMQAIGFDSATGGFFITDTELVTL